MLDLQEVTLHCREFCFLPDNPAPFVRYLSGLENELYKAMRALRDAQTFVLSTIDVVPARESGAAKNKA